MLATGWSDGVATIDDTRTGERLHAIDTHRGSRRGGVSAVVFSRDGSLLHCGGRGGEVQRWNTRTGGFEGSLETSLPGVGGLAISHDGTMLACTGGDGSAELWRLDGSAPPALLKGHLLGIYDATFSPDDRLLLTGSRDQTIRVWETRTGRLERVLEGHGQWVTKLAFTPDRSRLVTSSWFEMLTFWDGVRLEPIVSLRGHRRPVRSLAIAPSGDRIFTGDDDGTLLVWDRRERRQRDEAVRRAVAEASAARERVVSLLEDLTPSGVAQALEEDGTLSSEARRASLNVLLGAGLAEGPAEEEGMRNRAAQRGAP